MRNVEIERTLAVPRSAVWAVLADYPNIADWNDGVMKSFAIGDATEGVGAQRQTELVPDGKMKMRETVVEWVPDERMVVDIDKTENMPVKQATMTFTLFGGETTQLTMRYDYEPKNTLWSLLGPVLDRQFGKGFNGFIDILEPVAQAWTVPQ